MSQLSAKELYIMNGGNKVYIYKDGFGDVYNATPAEEAQWAQEVIERALSVVDLDTNQASFKGAVDNLLFHKYSDLEAILLKKMVDASPLRRVLFATALWRLFRHEKSFEILFLNQEQHRSECLSIVFLCLGDFKDNIAARKFILACIEGVDDILFAKAKMTIGIWAYSGMPALRENNLLETLRLENNKEIFTPAFKQLKQILGEG